MAVLPVVKAFSCEERAADLAAAIEEFLKSRTPIEQQHAKVTAYAVVDISHVYHHAIVVIPAS